MSNPVLRAFFLGRAAAEVLNEKIELGFTYAVSELGKFDAEQRENLRQFVEEVQARAAQTEPTEGNSYGEAPKEDLQQRIDELRAEIAQLKSELKTQRFQAN
jgi:uncharacterized protein YceH (UPF0502 family)